MENFSLNIGGALITRTAVYDKLYDAIVEGYLKPGQRLVERELATTMGISRTPIREAFRQLENDGLVKTLPYRGVVVNQLGVNEAQEVYQVRAELEGLVAELVAARVREEDLSEEINQLQATIDAYALAIKNGDEILTKKYNRIFHGILLDLAQQNLLKNLLIKLQAHVSLLSNITMAPRGVKTSIEHQAVLDAIKTGDSAIARQVMVRHIGALWEVAKTKLG